ncbi:MAG: endo-1,4-beta-xylanase [Candidatus Ratteibacteria bacterium]|nr:endo-1,4-beta-xylanase [Candidatus Ratteibacteria bacterium]
MRKFNVWLFIFTLNLNLGFTGHIYARAALADGHDKFLGNIAMGFNAGFTIPSNFDVYWNQVTVEDLGKWGEVEIVRDVMDWSGLDEAYDYARKENFPFKQHAFVWGQQEPDWIDSLSSNEYDLIKALPSAEPGWIKSLSPEEQRAEVEEWIRLFGERYPDTDFIDVVNEPLHAPPSYKDALGGDGSTGWDWVLWCFEKARQYCPNAKLLLNEYNILNDDSNATEYLQIINLLKDRDLIDGVGIQSHYFEFEGVSSNALLNNLDRLSAPGLPIYISEFDVDIFDDTTQQEEYERIFPLFWEHSAVKGMTLWGYMEGKIWKEDAYLIRADGTERPALVWLKEYLAVNEDENDGNDEGSDGGSSSAVKSCFIATACYGTPMAKEVKVLSRFRDEYLMDNSFGRIFVAAYYKVSPQIASFICEHPYLKTLVRWYLQPVVKVTNLVISGQ